jgi:hypothetical protein
MALHTMEGTGSFDQSCTIPNQWNFKIAPSRSET